MSIISAIMDVVKLYRRGDIYMIIYDPLWKTMEQKGFTTYTLRVKHGMSSGTVQRLKKNLSVSTNTLNDLCEMLDCPLSDVAEYVED